MTKRESIEIPSLAPGAPIPMGSKKWLDTPDTHRFMQKLIINGNYFQSMESDFDASHAPFLHRTLDNNARKSIRSYPRKLANQ